MRPFLIDVVAGWVIKGGPASESVSARLPNVGSSTLSNLFVRTNELGDKVYENHFFCLELFYELRSQVALESCRAELEEQTGLVLEVELNFAPLITYLCHLSTRSAFILLHDAL